LTVHTRTLTAKGITIKPFMNFRTETVMNPQRLEKALQDLVAIFHEPHFKTKPGRTFSLAEINDALGFTAAHGEKAILCPSA
jgi:ribosomal protein L13E